MTLFAAIDATWPPLAYHSVGPFTLREGQSGGQRVSAATCERPVTEIEIARAEEGMAALGQNALFMIRGDQPGLDDQLAALGYRIKDPVTVMTARANQVAGDGPGRARAFPVWPALAIQREIWATGGIGPERVAIMDRTLGPKATILGRVGDAPAGTAFVALHGTTAMMHAVEVLKKFRRRGCAVDMTRGAAKWALGQGAETFAILTTSENSPAIGVYSSLGLRPVGQYHYRVRPGLKPS